METEDTSLGNQPVCNACNPSVIDNKIHKMQTKNPTKHEKVQRQGPLPAVT